MPMDTKRHNKVTSLWKVVDAMQRQLEREGLDTAMVDAAVTRGLAELLAGPAPEREPRPVFRRRPKLAIVKA